MPCNRVTEHEPRMQNLEHMMPNKDKPCVIPSAYKRCLGVAPSVHNRFFCVIPSVYKRCLSVIPSVYKRFLGVAPSVQTTGKSLNNQVPMDTLLEGCTEELKMAPGVCLGNPTVGVSHQSRSSCVSMLHRHAAWSWLH